MDGYNGRPAWGSASDSLVTCPLEFNLPLSTNRLLSVERHVDQGGSTGCGTGDGGKHGLNVYIY